MKKVLVYGWYNQNNLGDELFKDAFNNLFPEFEFVFTDYIRVEHLKNIDAIFIGGGSLVGEPLRLASNVCLDDVKKHKIFYIGVGAETGFHPDTHGKLLPLAQLVALRSSTNFDSIKNENPNTIVINDLVYSLQSNKVDVKKPNSVLVIPNILVVPKWNSPHWKHASWEFFKTEFAQYLDDLLDKKYTVDFLPFCVNNSWNDCFVAGELISRLSNIKEKCLLDKPADLESAVQTISSYQMVITQRYHGAILADIAETPCLTIHHHDKLKNTIGSQLSYYACNKGRLWEETNNLLKNTAILPIDRNIYTSLRQTIIKLL